MLLLLLLDADGSSLSLRPGLRGLALWIIPAFFLSFFLSLLELKNLALRCLASTGKWTESERDRPTWRHALTALIGLQARSLPTGGLTATSSWKTTCYLLESKGRYLPRWDSPTPTPTKTIDFIPLRFFFSFFFIYFLVRFLVTCSYYLARKLDDQVLLFVCASLVCACDLGLCGCGFISKRREEPFLLVVTTGGVSCCPGALCVRIQRKDGSQEVAAALLCREEGFQEERCCSSPWFSEFRTTILIRLLEFPVFLSALFPLSALLCSNMGTFFSLFMAP